MKAQTDNHETPEWAETCDLIVAGAGAAGLAAAVTAAHHGLSVVLAEKAPVLGGTTAWSGGWIWAPDNPVARRAGVQEKAGDPQRYLEAVLGNRFDPELALANATLYLEAAGHIVIAWIWLQQYLAAAGKKGEFYEGKRQATRYFFRFELPKTGPQFDLLASLDRTTLEMEDSWF